MYLRIYLPGHNLETKTKTKTTTKTTTTNNNCYNNIISHYHTYQNTKMTTVSTSIPVANPMRTVLPSHGLATVKSVLSGDTVILTGRPTTTGQKAPVVIFTFERVTAPRYDLDDDNYVCMDG
jgi:hypothetical protein